MRNHDDLDGVSEGMSVSGDSRGSEDLKMPKIKQKDKSKAGESNWANGNM